MSHQIGAALIAPDGPKMLRETLCVAQTAIAQLEDPRREIHIARLEALIKQCDVHRPLGPDGTHGDRHTATCGCLEGEIDESPKNPWVRWR